MSNTWNQAYPTKIDFLLNRAEAIALEAKQKLNESDTPLLKDLFSEKQITNSKSQVIRNLKEFNNRGYIPNSYLTKKAKSKNEFMGLYIIGEKMNGEVIPIYIGISRTVYRRLRQHGWGKEHNQCTLAYLIANEEKHESKWANKRSLFPKTDLIEARDKVQNFRVVLYSVENDYDLYFLEVAIAGILKTKWNSFKTH